MEIGLLLSGELLPAMEIVGTASQSSIVPVARPFRYAR
jgi:hypothetical protein